MDLKLELILTAKLFASLLLGAIVGVEREMHGNAAGIRTYAAVALGAALFTLIGLHSGDPTSASRIVSNIVTGIGFLGAGIIYKDNAKRYTHGLTTASTVWATAAIGVSVAYDMYIIACCTTFAVYFLLALHHMKWYERLKQRFTRQDNIIK